MHWAIGAYMSINAELRRGRKGLDVKWKVGNSQVDKEDKEEQTLMCGKHTLAEPPETMGHGRESNKQTCLDPLSHNI